MTVYLQDYQSTCEHEVDVCIIISLVEFIDIVSREKGIMMTIFLKKIHLKEKKFIENNGTEVDKVKADEILCKFVTSRKWVLKMSSKRRDQNYDVAR